MQADHSNPKAFVKSVEPYLDDYWDCYKITFSCGGAIFADVVAMGEDEIAIVADDVHCSCHGETCPWENGLEVRDDTPK